MRSRPVPLLLLTLTLAGTTGCGDGGEGPGTTEADVVARVAAALARGDAPGSAAWNNEVDGFAEVLWPEAGEGRAVTSVAVHKSVLTVAADAAARLPREGRGAMLAHQPLDLGLHDAVLEALAAGPEAWRRFVDGPAVGWLDRKQAALREQLGVR